MLPLASKSPLEVESATLTLGPNDVLCTTCKRPSPSKMRPKMTDPVTLENAKIPGCPAVPQHALIVSPSMPTTLAVLDPGAPMNENVLVTDPAVPFTTPR